MSQRPHRDWRAAAAAAPVGGASKKLPLFVAGLSAAVVAACIVGLLYWLFAGEHTEPKYVGMPLCVYADEAWPPMPFAEADVNRVRARFPGGDIAFNNQESRLFYATLSGFEKVTERPLVVHVTGLAAVRGGIIYLLSSQAKPWPADTAEKPESWHPLDELFEAVRKCPSKNKLIILDLAHPVAHPSNGILADLVSTALYNQLHGMDELPATVLVSAQSREIAQSMDEEGASAFGFYLDEGLRGAADGFPQGEYDQWVKVRELTDFVTDRVKRWSARARGAVQTPYLVGAGDFRLASYAGRFTPAEVGEVKPLGYPGPFKAGWELRDQWATAPQRDLGPHLIRTLETALLRAEAEHRAGIAEGDYTRKLGDQRTTLEANWARLKDVVPPVKTVTLGIKVPPPLDAKLDGFIAGYDGKKKFAEVKGDLVLKPDEMAAAIGKRLSDVKIKRDLLLALVDTALPPGEKPLFADAVFFDKLRELASSGVYKRDERPWPDEAILAAARGELTYLDALAQTSPEGFRWLCDRLNALVNQRKEVEAILWKLGDEKFDDWRTGYRQVAERYGKIEKEAEAVREDGRRAAAAYATLLDGIPRLAGYGAWLLHRPIGDASGPWDQAVTSATLLADAFGTAKPSNFNGELLSAQSTRLTAALAELQIQFISQTQLQPFAVNAQAVLASPRLGIKEREAYLTNWRKWCAGKHQAIRESEWDTANQPGTTVIPPGDEAARAADRARLALDLARLAGADVTKLRGDAELVKEKRDAVAWNAFGPSLLGLDRVASGGSADRADRTGRVFGTSATPARGAGQIRKDFWQWLADRYNEEAVQRDLARAPFYQTAVLAAKTAAGRADAASRE